MIDHVKSFFNRYFPGGAPPLLLAMSGGRDSMVLAELLRLSGIAFEAAHLNYRLRGDESDKDCDHVVAWCRQQQIQLHQYVTTDEERDSLLQAGLQEKARNLRYTWFRSIISQRNGQYIVTAHHADDQAETMLFHFVRGSGIRGLAGMSEKQGDILRPLLKVDGSAIHNFAVKHGIIWRDDHSNATTDYSRNYIRHEVMPRLLEINP
ncbi:MAG: tRNA lysidine(34) synthetase TilS, partial [Flavobacteriales bacterium]|nr:tRNA lysidine(34) synthetase TilS [Flavobacteriales bacterium]